MLENSYQTNNIPSLQIHCISEKTIHPINTDYDYLQHVSNSLAAVSAGCDVLSINDLDINTDLRANISNLLRYEAQLNQVHDPYAGSYMIETITEELIKESLAALQKIEKEGGILSQI